MLGMNMGLWQNTAVLSGGGAVGVAFVTTTGVNKYSGITLSGSNLTVNTDGAGLYEFARADRATTQTGAFEYEVNINSLGTILLGIDDGTTDFSTANNIPGSSNSLGVALQWTGSAWNILRSGGVSQGPFASPTPGTSGKITTRCNKSGGTIGFYYGGTQIGVNETGVGFTNWFAFVGGKDATNTLTANFAGAFVFGTDPAY